MPTLRERDELNVNGGLILVHVTRARIVRGMAAAKPFIFVCGADDFLVNRAGKARFDELAKDVADEFSREVLSGFAGNVGEVETAINRFRESVQTISMFGGKRLVWFKDVNFLADTVTGRVIHPCRRGDHAAPESL